MHCGSIHMQPSKDRTSLFQSQRHALIVKVWVFVQDGVPALVGEGYLYLKCILTTSKYGILCMSLTVSSEVGRNPRCAGSVAKESEKPVCHYDNNCPYWNHNRTIRTNRESRLMRLSQDLVCIPSHVNQKTTTELTCPHALWLDPCIIIIVKKVCGKEKKLGTSDLNDVVHFTISREPKISFWPITYSEEKLKNFLFT